MPTAPDVLERAADLVETRALSLLHWCARYFEHYGFADYPRALDNAWILRLGSRPKTVTLRIALVHEPDRDGGLLRFHLEALDEGGRLYTGTGPWFPTVHVDRAWRPFEERVRDHQMADAVTVIIAATKCTACGVQEFVCHNAQEFDHRLPCCATCDHPIIIRRTS